jgi:prepilin-type N-terminal cleavage/methylation domain-containing protein
MKLGTAKKPGFTLIEMAIVLVVIGLILGMVYKGRALVDQGKVKHIIANRNKIIAAINTYYDRYGMFPGDGCQTAQPSNPMDCDPQAHGVYPGAVERNGNGGAQEDAAFWYLLTQKTHILNEADQESVFGQPWEIISHGALNTHWPGTYSFGSYMNLPGSAQSDPRIVCAVDKLIDDGNSATGTVFLNPGDSGYDQNTDCWKLSGQVNAVLKILP